MHTSSSFLSSSAVFFNRYRSVLASGAFWVSFSSFAMETAGTLAHPADTIWVAQARKKCPHRPARRDAQRAKKEPRTVTAGAHGVGGDSRCKPTRPGRVKTKGRRQQSISFNTGIRLRSRPYTRTKPGRGNPAPVESTGKEYHRQATYIGMMLSSSMRSWHPTKGTNHENMCARIPSCFIPHPPPTADAREVYDGVTARF